MTQNLIRRGHSWSVRYIIPTELRSIVGKKEIVRSLGTRDLDEARKLRHSALAQIVAEVDFLVFPEKTLLCEAKAVAQEIATSPYPDIIESLAADRAEDIERLHGEEAAGQYVDVALNGSMPVSEAGEQWLKSQEGNVTRGTIDGRRRVIKQFTDDIGDLSISAVTPRVATKWLSDYLEPSGRSPKTLGRYIGAMDLLWRWSRRREWCEGLSPFDGLTSELKKTTSTKRAFTDAELVTFMDSLKAKANRHPEEYDVGILLLESSARLNEIAELRVKDVYEDGEVRIHDGKTKSANRCLFFFSDRAKAILAKRAAGKEADDQLFHELKPGGQDQKLGHALSKRMRLSLAGVIPDASKQGLDLHSIRRWGAGVWESLEGLEGLNRTLMKRAFGHSVGDLLGDTYSPGAEKEKLRGAFRRFSEEALKRVP